MSHITERLPQAWYWFKRQRLSLVALALFLILGLGLAHQAVPFDGIPRFGLGVSSMVRDVSLLEREKLIEWIGKRSTERTS